jgi:hypothetical protein
MARSQTPLHIGRLTTPVLETAMPTLRTMLSLATLTVLILLGPVATSRAEILVSSNLGNTWDWLIGANPLFVFPMQTRVVGLQVANNPFNPPALTGSVQLQVECCLDMISRAPVTPSGVAVQLVPVQCPPLIPGGGALPGPDPGLLPGPAGPGARPLRLCPPTARLGVNVTPTSVGGALLSVTTSGTAAPGGYIARIHADSTLGRSSKDVYLNVLPASWPADGPLPACPPPVTVMSLASVAPTPFVWKATNLAGTSYGVGVRFVSASPAAGAGLRFVLVDPGGTGPIPRNVTTITFKNTKGRPAGMRTVNSASCGAPGQQVLVSEGETKSISISRTSTTTLVFSKSTCRAWIDWFYCWGGSALGLDDIVVFSEGPFWTLFGGRKVDIETVGDWGALFWPASIATIRTQ